MALTMEENEAYKEMDLLDSVSSLGGRVVRKTGELKDLLSYARSWKFWLCLVVLVALIVFVFLWADAKGQYRQVDGGVVPGHDKDDDTVKKTHISVKMEFMHNVSDGNTVAEVPIRFNTVQVRLSSSLVVNNSVIVVPWEGNYALESMFFDGQLKVMVYTRTEQGAEREWKEMALAKTNHDEHFTRTHGHIHLKKGDMITFIMVPKEGVDNPSCSDRNLRKCAIFFSGDWGDRFDPNDYQTLV